MNILYPQNSSQDEEILLHKRCQVPASCYLLTYSVSNSCSLPTLISTESEDMMKPIPFFLCDLLSFKTSNPKNTTSASSSISQIKPSISRKCFVSYRALTVVRAENEVGTRLPCILCAMLKLVCFSASWGNFFFTDQLAGEEKYCNLDNASHPTAVDIF